MKRPGKVRRKSDTQILKKLRAEELRKKVGGGLERRDLRDINIVQHFPVLKKGGSCLEPNDQ